MTFPRDRYYSQTEVLKKFRISLNELRALDLPHLTREADLGSYKVKAKYFFKEMIDELGLPLKE